MLRFAIRKCLIQSNEKNFKAFENLTLTASAYRIKPINIWEAIMLSAHQLTHIETHSCSKIAHGLWTCKISQILHTRFHLSLSLMAVFGSCCSCYCCLLDPTLIIWYQTPGGKFGTKEGLVMNLSQDKLVGR